MSEPVPPASKTMRPSAVVALFALTAVGACAPDADTSSREMDPTPATEMAPQETATGTVRILAPAEGATLDGSDVTVELEVTGVRIVAAGDTTSGTGHHHLYLDAELTPGDQPVPSVPGSIIHMGDGSATYTFEGVAPGDHRIIAVVADGVHVPLQPWVVDTVTFTVR